MNITLFGANGAIGEFVLEEALRDKENTVTAYVRRPDSINMSHPNLKVIVGELNNRALVEHAIEQSEVLVRLVQR
ncbi:NAD(P)H-binding protein [Paenibacillus sp. 1001270B_150601_E10]|uniref:NAD(P)H-binding protein n=1 Tax=Paenibacillus sp. 1001270B_150601_E10 TaxID=2787079 RepID=UPI0018A03CB8|nr:NAD(P)H-binding protein [Paenibacillus sp. 1001270B_150601_E10]